MKHNSSEWDPLVGTVFACCFLPASTPDATIDCSAFTKTWSTVAIIPTSHLASHMQACAAQQPRSARPGRCSAAQPVWEAAWPDLGPFCQRAQQSWG